MEDDAKRHRGEFLQPSPKFQQIVDVVPLEVELGRRGECVFPIEDVGEDAIFFGESPSNMGIVMAPCGQVVGAKPTKSDRGIC